MKHSLHFNHIARTLTSVHFILSLILISSVHIHTIILLEEKPVFILSWPTEAKCPVISKQSLSPESLSHLPLNAYSHLSANLWALCLAWSSTQSPVAAAVGCFSFLVSNLKPIPCESKSDGTQSSTHLSSLWLSSGMTHRAIMYSIICDSSLDSGPPSYLSSVGQYPHSESIYCADVGCPPHHSDCKLPTVKKS